MKILGLKVSRELKNVFFFVAITFPLPWLRMFSCNGCLFFLSKVLFIMFISQTLVHFALFFVSSKVEADYLKINWNISTHQKNSHFEREYKYPMYEDVAPAFCDLTDSCDAFCHQDPDCDESQKRSFKSYKSDKTCDSPLSPLDCGCDYFDKPEWLSVFCFIFKNPVYLGKFFKTPKKIENLANFKKLLKNKRLLKQEVIKSKTENLFHSPIMTFVPTSESFPSVKPLVIKAPIKESSYACKFSSVRHRHNHLSVCLIRITPELCERGLALSALPYLVQGNNMTQMPVVIKDLDFLKGVKSEVSIKCVKLKSISKRFKQQERNYFLQDDFVPCDDSLITYKTVFSGNTCRNVLVSVNHEFMLNGSDLVQLSVKYKLGDVPLYLDNVNQKYIYLKQIFSVNFYDIMTNTKQNYSGYDELLNRGYFVGEELNFGYKQNEQ